MRTYVLALFAFLVSVTTAHAQKAVVPAAPIKDCSGIVGRWNNPYDVVIDLEMAADCSYKIGARGRMANGKATLQPDGTITIYYTDPDDDTTYRLVVRRHGEVLSGKVHFLFFWAPPIVFFPVKK
ncbi:hypothetical protein K2Q00_01705 [Patescibacteria group bacterium]|nr:hypothetical protein [Patescibacteria group bacterium]